MKIVTTRSYEIFGSYLKNQFREYKLNYFNGRIQNNHHVKKWIEGKNFDVIIRLAVIIATSILNKNKNKALTELTIDNSKPTILFGISKFLRLRWLPRKINYENYLLKII